jgi:radical SAM protein with 4Fe4S-binding SPASM domain
LTPEILAASKTYCGAVAVSYAEGRAAKVEESVKALVAAGIQTNVHVVMLRDRITYLPAIAEQCAAWGARSVVFLLFKPVGRGNLLAGQVVTDEDRPVLVRQILRLLEVHGRTGLVLSFDACSAPLLRDFPFLTESIDGCNGSRNSAYVDWTLAMKPCSFMQGVPGVSLRDHSMEDAWQSPLFREFRAKIMTPRYDGCGSCDYFGSCWGGCPLDPTLVVCEKKGDPISWSVPK